MFLFYFVTIVVKDLSSVAQSDAEFAVLHMNI